MKRLMIAFLAVAPLAGFAQTYETRVVLSGLERPTGIAVSGVRRSTVLYLTQLPTPGVPGNNGGRNRVDAFHIATNCLTNLTTGEPEPTNLALGGGELYWTCKSAGVILERNFRTGKVSPFLTGLAQPSGIAFGAVGEIYFTQLPTPGVPGGMGGKNTVDVAILGRVFNLTDGEPEPTDIAAGPDGDVYWTCKSANVILKRTPLGQVSVLDSNVEKPTGITISRDGKTLFWTEVPTPGQSGGMGGRNKVVRLDLGSMTKTVVDLGDPDPVDVTVARDGTLYWTCRSAGVIVEARLQH